MPVTPGYTLIRTAIAKLLSRAGYLRKDLSEQNRFKQKYKFIFIFCTDFI